MQGRGMMIVLVVLLYVAAVFAGVAVLFGLAILFRAKDEYHSPYQHIYDMIASDDPEVRERGGELIMRTGPVPGSYGDRNSYGPGRCHHMAGYPGCRGGCNR